MFQPYPDDTYDECTGGGDGEEEVVSATVTEMPSKSLEGLWESLIYADGVKSKLLDYIYATISFSDADVDCKDPYHSGCEGRIADYMRSILVLQSTSCPGTEWFSSTDRQEPEKRHYAGLWRRNSLSVSLTSTYTSTELRLLESPHSLPPTSSRYDHARLLEINAHSLFSKWFSESGKLVQALFGNVMEMIEEGNRFVVVLIGRALSPHLEAGAQSVY